MAVAEDVLRIDKRLTFINVQQVILCDNLVYSCFSIAFPCAALYDKLSGRLAIYYGGADTVTCLTFARMDEVLDFVKSTSDL